MTSSLDPDKYMAQSGGLSPRLFNPLSGFNRSGVEEYPEFFANLFPGSARAGWLAAKMTAATLLGVALFGGARAIQGAIEASETDRYSDPAKKIKRQVGTTYEYGGQRKQAGAVVERPGMMSVVDNAANVAMPTLALLLAGLGTYKIADKMFDKAWTKKTEKAVAANDALVQRLIETRARLAKGNATDREVQDVLADAGKAGYIKQAADLRPSTMVANLATAIGLLTAGAGILTGIGAYKYFKESNPENIKYKAMKKGLSEYARRKAEMTPLAMIADKAMLDRIDKEPADKQSRPGSVRDQPEADASRRALSLTLD